MAKPLPCCDQPPRTQEHPLPCHQRQWFPSVGFLIYWVSHQLHQLLLNHLCFLSFDHHLVVTNLLVLRNTLNTLKTDKWQKGVTATGFEPASPRRDLNPQSLAPRASTLSIRSLGALPVSYAVSKQMERNSLTHPRWLHLILQKSKGRQQ